MLKRSHMGTFHMISPKHLNRFVQELVARHKMRLLDTIDRSTEIAFDMEGNRLSYR